MQQTTYLGASPTFPSLPSLHPSERVKPLSPRSDYRLTAEAVHQIAKEIPSSSSALTPRNQNVATGVRHKRSLDNSSSSEAPIIPWQIVLIERPKKPRTGSYITIKDLKKRYPGILDPIPRQYVFKGTVLYHPNQSYTDLLIRPSSYFKPVENH